MMREKKCLNCGKFFKQKHKNHKFCCTKCKLEYEHDHRKIIYKCDNCHKEYISKNKKRSNHNFCSKECEIQFKCKINHETRKCEFCGKDFDCTKNSTQRFCSMHCQNKWQKTRVGILNPKFTSKLIFCEWCGKKYYEKVSKINNKQHHFCSKDCRREWYSQEYTQTIEWKEYSRNKALLMLETGKFNKVNTHPQREINNLLNKLNISYKNEKVFGNFAVDNYLVNYNKIIEVMGTYWHTDNRFYPEINYSMQVNRIRIDKIKHNYIKNKHNIEILYLWEYDIENNIDMCKQLILKYINNEILLNYNSFNYQINKDNNKLMLNKNKVIIPYMQWDKKELNNIIDIKTKIKMCKKQQEKWITFKCENCGKEREELISHYKKHKHHYCCRECSAKGRIHKK
jgi:hypothetical protein